MDQMLNGITAEFLERKQHGMTYALMTEALANAIAKVELTRETHIIVVLPDGRHDVWSRGEYVFGEPNAKVAMEVLGYGSAGLQGRPIQHPRGYLRLVKGGLS